MKPKVAVVGLGYVGLPLAMLFAKGGCRVFGIDVDEKKIAMLNEGMSYLMTYSDEDIKALNKRPFTAAVSFEAVKEADAIILCVPTPLTANRFPNLSYVQTAIQDLLPYMETNKLVVLESSTYPGTTEEVLVPLFEKAGFIAGVTISIGYSPERIDPGNEQFPFESVPKVVSGATASCIERISRLYEPYFQTLVPVSSPKIAEMAKMLENTQRFINISFMNEMARICHELDIDIWEVLDAAETKPFGFFSCQPGPGVGGHCIPVDPIYLKWKANQADCLTEFIDLAKRTNDSQPAYMVSRVKELLPTQLECPSILLIGVTYKKDINDLREAAAPLIAQQLLNEGYKVDFHDPYVERIKMASHELRSVELTDEALSSYTLVVIVTDHSSVPYERIVHHSNLIFDTRNRIKSELAHIKRL